MNNKKSIVLRNALFISSILYIAFAILRLALKYYDSLILDIPFVVGFVLALFFYFVLKKKNIVINTYFIFSLIICVLGCCLTFELKQSFLDLIVYGSYPFVFGIGVVYWFIKLRINYKKIANNSQQ